MTADSPHASPHAGSARTQRSLDHFVSMVGDIETGAEMYRRLGFRVMPTMEHVEIGTSNAIVQFHHTYLELIGDFRFSRSDQINTMMGPWQALGEYLYWQTSFTSARLEEDREGLIAKGMQPEQILNAYRRVRKIGGGWDQTASRSMYCFNRANMTGSLFISDHARPETIWMPGYTCHPNTAQRVIGISYVARDPEADIAYYAAMLGGEPSVASPERVAFHTPRGEFFELLSPAAAAEKLPGADPLQDGCDIRGAAYTITVESLERCRLALRDGGVPRTSTDNAIHVAAPFAGGMAITFVTA
jgi:hypothetical protein